MTRNLYFSSHSPYYIYALDYIQQSAGVRVLHYLCHALNESGLEAYVTCKVTAPHLRTPVLNRAIEKRHQASGREPIVVYPEVVSGNPLGARNVVRWLLNQPGHIAGDKYFSDGDLIFAYDPVYLPPGMKAEILHIPTVDLSIFNNKDNFYDQQRDLVCFYAHKYLGKGGLLSEHVKGAVSLCKDQVLTPSEIAAILRRSKLLYVYEPTALITEALLCGCPVSIIQTDYWRDNTANLIYKTDFGVAMDDRPESLEIAKENVHNFQIKHEKFALRWAWGQLDNFVELTQKIVMKRSVSFIKSEMMGQEALPDFGSDDPYRVWQNNRSRPDSFWQDFSGCREISHFIVFVSEETIGRVSETFRSITEQVFPHWRATFVSKNSAPDSFTFAENIAWLNIQNRNLIDAVNNLVVEDPDSDFMIFLQAGDVIEPHALISIVSGFEKHPGWSIAFADQDALQLDGTFENPFFKPDFELDMLRAAPFLSDGLMAIRRSTFLEIGGFGSSSYGAERFELILRAYENSGESGVGHISDVLCHRPVDVGSDSFVRDEIIASRRNVLQGHLARIGTSASVEDAVMPGTFRIRYHHDGETAVSIIIPTLNGGAMLQSSVNAVVENTEFKNWELIVVDRESDDAATMAFLDYLRDFNNDAIRVITQPRSASFPAVRNAGAHAARQDYLLFLSDSTQPLRNDWLDEMLGYAVQPGVGVVGVKAVGTDGNVSNAGYVLGLGGQPAGLHDLHVPLDDSGYFGRLQVPGNPSAVSSACMLTEKKLFDELGGFDEHLLAAGYSDVDYCLKVGKASQRVVWTPFALMFQPHEIDPPEEIDVDEDADAETHRSRILPGPTAQVMFDRWRDRIAFDPAYNRNLSLSLAAGESYVRGFEIETLPALTWDPDFRPMPRVLAFTGGGEGREENRIVAPMRALVNAGKVQGADTAEFLSIPELARISPDVLIFQYRQEGYQSKLIESYARNSRALRIFELDVLLSNTQLYQDNSLADTLNMSDRLVVPTEYMAYEYRKFSPEIHVVPDQIERSRWGALNPKRMQGRKPRVGWAGSAVHEADLANIAEVVKVLQDEVEWVFFGLCPEGTRSLVEYHGGVVNRIYPSKLASLDLDLALSPLQDNPFNHAGSHMPLLEYGALGYPVIATDITPYRGAYPITRVRNRTQDWVDAIREHVSDLDELARRGDVLRDYVEGNWMLEDNLDVWLKAWVPSLV